jgi:hypothetical protein
LDEAAQLPARARALPRPGMLQRPSPRRTPPPPSRARRLVRPRADARRRVAAACRHRPPRGRRRPPHARLHSTKPAPLPLLHSPFALSLSPFGEREREPRLLTPATACHHLRRRVSTPANRFSLIARTPRSAISPSPPNKQQCCLSHYGKAQLSVSRTRHHGRVTELMLRPPASSLLLSPREPFFVFAISSRTWCTLYFVRSWPGMAIGR